MRIAITVLLLMFAACATDTPTESSYELASTTTPPRDPADGRATGKRIGDLERDVAAAGELETCESPESCERPELGELVSNPETGSTLINSSCEGCVLCGWTGFPPYIAECWYSHICCGCYPSSECD